MFGKKEDKTKSKMNKNATSMQRRLQTPIILTYFWFHTSFLTITTGIFFLVNYALWILLTLGKKTVYLGALSSVRIPNNYRPDAIRFIYYIDEKVVARMLIPACCMVAIGIAMLITRGMVYRLYVSKEVFKEKSKNSF